MSLTCFNNLLLTFRVLKICCLHFVFNNVLPTICAINIILQYLCSTFNFVKTEIQWEVGKYCAWSMVVIGITHVFSCINICRVPRMLFEHEADKPSVQHHPRDPASVNAMKQTCVIVILAYFTLFQLNSH